jgi:predicted DNA-binding WGR domain protein
VITPADDRRAIYCALYDPTADNLTVPWSLVREWGRIGSPGTVQARSFDSEAEARRVERQGIRKRERHGYQPAPDVVSRWSAMAAAGISIHAPEKRSQNKSKKGRYLDRDKQGVFDF